MAGAVPMPMPYTELMGILAAVHPLAVNEGELAMAKKVLLVLVILVLLGSVVLGAGYRQELHYECRVAEGGRLSIYNVTGNITVQTWDKDYVDVRAVKTTNRSLTELDKVKIEVISGSAARIKTVYLTNNASVGVDYDIRVPEDAVLDAVENVTGNVHLEEVRDVTSVKNITGNLFVKSAAGPVRADCVTGNIKVYFAKLKGDTAAKLITGQIDLYLPGDLDAALDLSVTTGNITNDGLKVILGSFAKLPTHLDGTLGTGGPKIRAEVVTGGISLHKF